MMAGNTPASRYPLAETTNRVNVTYVGTGRADSKSKHRSEPPPTISNSTARTARGQRYATHSDVHLSSPAPTHNDASSVRASSVLRPPSEAEDTKRHSQASYASTSSSRSKAYKSHIGPWQLGKTLGKGSSARVRLCRHNVTHQHAAVKIVNRKMAYLVQDSSLAALSKWDKGLPEERDGEMRIPMSIEREVAILKLIEHPHIMKLYDIWENRSEIYLILEYIDQGDLFTFINSRGRLSEEVSIYFFRQMISAITYCHSFNICHRDLKPENILITANHQIKIADFGMAALHQTDTHHLATACGSPHYAAPELLKNRQYRGDKADIWSMGVILYAMLSATLPFDDPDLRVMMGKTKKGLYEMPQGLSLEAEDLIRRMLQTNPDRRISLREIWRHPLVQKYSYLDNLGDNSGQPPDTRKGFQYAPVPRQNIDPQLLRQLRSMWHMFSEQDLALKLTCNEPNDQKAFYWLLHNYRDKQLEDFKPELAHSMSDYHHLKPAAWKKRVSTCEFAQPGLNGHVRSVSRFTVISTAAETESGTVQSYDPYRGSRVLHSSQSQASQARVTVHRDSQLHSHQAAQGPASHSGSNARRGRVGSIRNSVHGRPVSSRGSMTSIRSGRSGRQNTPHARGPSLRHKRGVDFTHVRKPSGSVISNQGTSQPKTATVVAGPRAPSRIGHSPSPDVPAKAIGAATRAKSRAQTASTGPDVSVVFQDELRNFSSGLAKDLDEAFGSTLMEADSAGGSLTDAGLGTRDTSPLTFTFESIDASTPNSEVASKAWDLRPLPPLPDQSALSSHPVVVSTPGTSRNSPHDVTRHAVSGGVHLQPPHVDRRAVSAPVYTQSASMKATSLPSINENGGAAQVVIDKARIVSAPPHTPPRRRQERLRSAEYLSRIENTIRVVHSPTAYSPVKAPAPLNVRKKGKVDELGRSIHRQFAYHAEADERTHESGSQTSADGGRKKMTSWFKRVSTSDSDYRASEKHTGQALQSRIAAMFDDRSAQGHEDSLFAATKRNFTFSFWKNDKNREPKMSMEAQDKTESNRSSAVAPHKVAKKEDAAHHWRNSRSDSGIRHIEVKQNWLARLFKVKPATSHICMVLSRKRARQEVAIQLREWRKYGIGDIVIDKQRNIVFARVSAKNYLNLKEVEFAAEIMAVIEHGKKQPLSIVRFTQERGAASSFHKVVQTLNTVFENRNLLVMDKNRRKMMIRTLNSCQE